MKELFKSIFLAVILLFLPALPTEAMTFDIADVPGIVGALIHVDVDDRLANGPVYYGGVEYSARDWFTLWAAFAINSLLTHPNGRGVRNVEFRTVAPQETQSVFTVQEPWEVHVINRGTTAVVVCHSSADMDIALLHTNYHDFIGNVIISLMFPDWAL